MGLLPSTLTNIFLREINDLSKVLYVTTKAFIFYNYGCESKYRMAKILGYFQMEKIEVLFVLLHLATPSKFSLIDRNENRTFLAYRHCLFL